MYATYTGDPATAPWTKDVKIPFALQVSISMLALVLTLLCVGLRIYVRRHIVKKMKLDDWMLIAAEISYIAYIFFNIGWIGWAVVNGLEKTWWTLYSILFFWKLSFTPCAVLVRAAIATLFLRSLPSTTHKKQRIIIISLFWIYTGMMVAQTFVDMFQCGNPTHTSFYYFETAVCIPGPTLVSIFIASGCLTTALDWLMTLVPILLVIRSNIARKAKISAILVLCLAGSGSVFAILSVANPKLIYFTYPCDVPGFVLYILLRLIENGFGIMAVSLAACRPLLERFLKARRGESSEPSQLASGGSSP